MNKSEKIRGLIKAGKDVASIAKTLKVSPNYVYTIRWKMQNKSGKKKSGYPKITAPKEAVLPKPSQMTQKPTMSNASINMMLTNLADDNFCEGLERAIEILKQELVRVRSTLADDTLATVAAKK